MLLDKKSIYSISSLNFFQEIFFFFFLQPKILNELTNSFKLFRFAKHQYHLSVPPMALCLLTTSFKPYHDDLVFKETDNKLNRMRKFSNIPSIQNGLDFHYVGLESLKLLFFKNYSHIQKQEILLKNILVLF